MAKANKLVISTRQRIGKYKEENPDTTLAELAAKFNCTFNQARKAVADWNEGTLRRPAVRKQTIKIDTDSNSDEIIERQFHLAVCQLEADSEMTVETRINLVEKCIKIRKILQSLRLERHIKRADAVLFGIIVKMYEPDASDDRIIEIYNQAVEIYKNEE